MKILAFILSVLGTICICIPPLLKGKNMKLILLLIFLTNILLATSYFLTGAFNGTATCCVGAIQTIINYFLERKNKPVPVWLVVIYAFTFTIVNLLLFTHLTDIIALLAALTFVFGISQKSGKGYRIWTMANALLWIMYDFTTLSIGPLSTHAIQLTTILIGMVMHDKKKDAIIFGDSYSTFKNFVPDGFAIYYSENEHPELGVTQASQTWWHQVCEKANLNLVQNNSWSGSTIGYTGYDNSDCSKSSSFIYRLKQLIENSFFEKNEINTVFVFGGTNDSWSNAPLGEMKFGDWDSKDLYFVLPAICYFFNLLRETLPQANIYCLINNELKSEISNCMITVCKKSGIIPVNFDTIDKIYGHPTVQGMNDIAEKVLNTLYD